MAEPIEIIIRKGTGGSGDGFGIAGAKPKGRDTAFGTELAGLQKKEESENKKLNMMITAMALSQAKKAISFGISQYGNSTGNYIKQGEIQLALQVASDIGSIIGAGAAGYAINPAMAPITAAIQAVNVGTNYYYQFKGLQIEIAKLDTYSNIMRERSGNATGNGSRGTDY